jgi:hypothetical protein
MHHCFRQVELVAAGAGAHSSPEAVHKLRQTDSNHNRCEPSLGPRFTRCKYARYVAGTKERTAAQKRCTNCGKQADSNHDRCEPTICKNTQSV